MNLTEAPLPEVLRKLAIPAGVAFFLNTLFNVTDTFFAGKLSVEALAGLALSFPVFFVLIAISAGFNQGNTALMSQAIGGGAPKRATRLFAQASSIAAVLGVLVMLLVWPVSGIMLSWMGADGAARQEALNYLFPALLCAPFFLLGGAQNALLTANGNTTTYRNALAVGLAVNAILDPLLMFGWGPVPALGVAGVGYATLGVQMVIFAYLGWHLYASKLVTVETCNQKDFAPDMPVIADIMKQSLPATANMATIGLGLAIITGFAARHGDAVVAGYGAAIRIEQLILLPVIGLTMAQMAITGQNFGAGKLDRVREVLKLSTLYAIGIMLVGALLILLFGESIMRIFTSDPATIREGQRYLTIEIFAFPGWVMMFTAQATLQGTKQPMAPMLAGIFRQIVLAVPVIWFFDQWLGLDANGLWIGVVFNSLLVSSLLYTYNYVKLGRMQREDRQNDVSPEPSGH